MKVLKISSLLFILILGFSSCKTAHQSMREANVLIELERSDFELSEQVKASATRTLILGIDFSRLLKKETGATVKTSITSGSTIETAFPYSTFIHLPIIGELVSNKTAHYALYNLFQANPGYDVLFYPQYKIELKRYGLGIFYRKTTVEVTARMGKLKND